MLNVDLVNRIYSLVCRSMVLLPQVIRVFPGPVQFFKWKGKISYQKTSWIRRQGLQCVRSRHSYRCVYGSHTKGKPLKTVILSRTGVGKESFHKGRLSVDVQKCSWQLGFFLFPANRGFLCICFHRKGIFSYYMATEEGQIHTPHFLWRHPDRILHYLFLCCSS